MVFRIARITDSGGITKSVVAAQLGSSLTHRLTGFDTVVRIRSMAASVLILTGHM